MVVTWHNLTLLMSQPHHSNNGVAAQHPPPFPVDDAAAEAGGSGGFLTFVIQSRHVATADRVDAVAWALLTLHTHIDVHVKRFKVCPLHACLAVCSKQHVHQGHCNLHGVNAEHQVWC